jgi:predicted lipoprotein
MLKKIIYLLSAAVVIVACSSKGNPDPEDNASRVAMLSNVGNNIIVPSFDALLVSSKTLAQAANDYAGDTKNEAKLTALQTAWTATAASWKIASLFKQGPIEDDFLLSGIYYTSTSYSAIEKAISQSGATIDDAYIENLGATVKGLPAIEYMVFSNDGNAALIGGYAGINGAKRIAYLKALCLNLQNQAAKVSSKWRADGDNYLKTFTEADGRDINSSFGILANKMIDLVYTIKDERLGAPIGKRNNGTPQPGLVDASLSKKSLILLKAELKSVENAFTGKSLTGTDGAGIDDILDKAGAKSGAELLSSKIKTQFATVYSKIDLITVPLDVAVTTQQTQVNAVYDEVKKLQVLMEVDMINNLGVLLTFSDNDGD